jgi:hypothetical protein
VGVKKIKYIVIQTSETSKHLKQYEHWQGFQRVSPKILGETLKHPETSLPALSVYTLQPVPWCSMFVPGDNLTKMMTHTIHYPKDLLKFNCKRNTL